MTVPITRKFVQDYFAAQVSRDPARIAPLVHDDVVWSIAGPVDLLHFCGERHGKSAMLEAVTKRIPAVLKTWQVEFDEILIDGDRVAWFTRLKAVLAATGRSASYRCAQFLRFRDGKLAEFRSLIDSFNAAEQVLGHSIDASPSLNDRRLDLTSNRVAL